jgi:pimeloyl-ACP methyl ester carboxylesterase
MNGFAKKVMSKDGCDIHYWVSRGPGGPWLIFLHGAGADHRMFDSQLPVLEGRFRMLLWDARGHGRSRPMGKDFSIALLVDDLIQIMAREAIARADWIGHSMGGNIAQEMAFLHPDKVSRLVLIDCTCNTMKLSVLEELSLKAAAFLLPLVPWRFLVEWCAKASSIRPGVRHYLRETLQAVGKRDFIKIFRKTACCLHEEAGCAIGKKLLLVCGKFDETGNIKKITPRWKSCEPQAAFFLIPGAGHCANQDHPAAFNRLLVEFLNQ